MQPRRLLIAFLVAVAISGAFTLWLGKAMSRKHAAGSGTLRYVTVTRLVDAGETLAQGDVTLTDWQGQPVTGAFTKAQDAVGKAAVYPLAPGSPVLDRQVSSTAAGLSGRIPEGMRAISLKSNDIVGVAGYMLPGTRVDVLVTVHDPQTQEAVTSTVLQDAQVMTAGQKMQPDPDGKAARVDVVTLLVSPDDAQKVALASAQGTVQFVLRNGGDHSHTAEEPVRFSRLSGATPAATKVAEVRMPKSPKATNNRYTVQIRRGDKDSVETF